MEYGSFCSLIVVAYNSQSVINEFATKLDQACLNLEEEHHLACSLVLVDNQPETDWPTARKIEAICASNSLSSVSLQTPRVIRSKVNSGFGSGCNLGVSTVTGGPLLFLNPDAFLTRDSLSVLYCDWKEATRRFGTSSILACDLRNINFSPSRNVGRLPEYTMLKSRSLSRLEPGTSVCCEQVIPSSLIWPLGASCLIDHSHFQMAGGFDESFFLTCEEPDLVRRLGNYYLYVSKSVVVHEGGHSYSSSREELLRFRCGLITYFNKYRGHNILFTLRMFILLLKLSIKISFTSSRHP